MNTATLDPVRAAAIERELSAIGTTASRLQRRQRRTRGLSLTLGSVALVAALTGAAIVVNNLPGTTTVAPLGEIVFSGSFTGTANVELGNPPADAAVVILDVTCTEGGRMEVPVKGEGASTLWDCDNPIRKDTVHIRDGRLPAAGTTYITITADPGTEWSVTARYGSSDTTPWGVNANGQTYGVPNENGVPDLVAALATNGVQGYTLDEEMAAFEGEGFINVYKSDGTTVIGQFRIGDQE